jgi:mannitol-specific phosphotransferase system IIBC component
MAYSCPLCDGAVQRGSGDSTVKYGLIGSLFVDAFGGFCCSKCGKIESSKFPSGVQFLMHLSSFILVVIGVVMTVGCIAAALSVPLIIYLLDKQYK